MIHALINPRLLSVPMLIGVVIFGFLLIKMAPGDPAQIMAAPTATLEIVAQIRQQMGLDEPLLVQLGRYAERLLQGDLGRSLISHRTVLSELAAAVPMVDLMIASLIWAVPPGIAMITIAAARRGSWLDRLILATSVACHFAESLFLMPNETAGAESPALARRLRVLADARKDGA